MKKRIISALLAVCLLVSLGTVGVFADGAVTLKVDSNATYENETAPVRAEGATYKTLQEAIDAAEAGDTIELKSDVSADLSKATGTNGAAYVINKDLTFNGNGHSVKAEGTNATASVFNVLGNGTSVTFKNLTINGAEAAKHGVNVFANASETVSATLNGVAISGCTGYGVCNTRSSVTATSLTVTAPENAWGAVDVDARDNGASLNLTSSNINGNLVLDSDEKGANTVSLTGGTYATVMTNTYDEAKGEHRSEGTNNITIDGAAVETVSLNGKGEDTVEISGATVDKIESTNSNTNNPNISLSNSKIGTVPTDDIVDMVIGSGVTIGGEPVDTKAEAEINGQPYATLAEALEAATDGQTVKLLKHITVTVNGQTPIYTIDKDITLDGNGKTITAEGSKPVGSNHIILVTANGATVQNLTINVNDKATSGIQAYKANNVELNNVSIKNSAGAAVIVNASSVTATKLTTTGSEWGGVNVDNGPGTTGNASFTLVSGTVESVYTEAGSETTQSATVTIKGGTVYKVYNSVNGTGTNTIKIENGYIGSVYDETTNDKANISVTGGTFDKAVADKYVNTTYVASGTNGYVYTNSLSAAIAAAGQDGYVDYRGKDDVCDVTFYYDKYNETTVEVPYGDYIEMPTGRFGDKAIVGWKYGSETLKPGERDKITSDRTYYVVLKDGEFDITIDSKIDHGTITTNVNSADRGDVVRIYVDPDTGYVLDELKVYTGTNYRTSVKVTYVNDSTYRFTMPGDDVYITATFKANGMPFVDVHRTQWFYDSIYYVWSNDMMEGDSATTFNPDGTMTRAMFWAVLGRMDGQTITGTNWVEQARNWAMREGVSDGTNPNDYVTREQMVTMLWRYAGEKNGSANLNRYTDSGSVSGYAVEAMRWAIGNGVVQGVTSTTLAPKANATRAECATIFMRFDKM